MKKSFLGIFLVLFILNSVHAEAKDSCSSLSFTSYLELVPLEECKPEIKSENIFPFKEDDCLRVERLYLHNSSNCYFGSLKVRIQLNYPSGKDRGLFDGEIPHLDADSNRIIEFSHLEDRQCGGHLMPLTCKVPIYIDDKNNQYSDFLNQELGEEGDYNIIIYFESGAASDHPSILKKGYLSDNTFKVGSKVEIELLNLEQKLITLTEKLLKLNYADIYGIEIPYAALAIFMAVFAALLGAGATGLFYMWRDKNYNKRVIRALIAELKKNAGLGEEIVKTTPGYLKFKRAPFNDFSLICLEKVLTENIVEDSELFDSIQNIYLTLKSLNLFLIRLRGPVSKKTYKNDINDLHKGLTEKKYEEEQKISLIEVICNVLNQLEEYLKTK